ncbi:hypothetical protein MB84_04085 [Pandoraea oxalativorans]|uniref:Uncharacterized protein n=1 Tax=Pandoraea oxalativorans TaxID=573737 RepID=A0A0E3U5R1_9BURK|nr:hypothetical protein MB84_04085 [Pandoraea oxalativorans]
MKILFSTSILAIVGLCLHAFSRPPQVRWTAQRKMHAYADREAMFQRPNTPTFIIAPGDACLPIADYTKDYLYTEAICNGMRGWFEGGASDFVVERI